MKRLKSPVTSFLSAFFGLSSVLAQPQPKPRPKRPTPASKAKDNASESQPRSVTERPKSAPKPKAGQRRGGELALSPSRFELNMLPGSTKTVVVGVLHSSVAGGGKRTRLVASLNDWTIAPDGKVNYFKAETHPTSATPWMVFSPAEFSVKPGQSHAIRVTITVPKDATPGDHTAALVVAPRPANIRRQTRQKQMLIQFRMAAIFYVMVPQLSAKPLLKNLTATATKDQILITPTLHNEGNHHVRPLQSAEVTDKNGQTVASFPQNEALPVLAGNTLSVPITVSKKLTPGQYSVRYRVSFKQKQLKVVEGRTSFVVRE